MALAKQQRLGGTERLQEIFRQGKTVRNSFFFIRYRLNALPFCRLAVTVPVRVARLAVTRNRQRRVVMEIMKELLIGQSGLDLVVVLTSPILEKTKLESKAQLAVTTKKIFVNQ